MSALRDLPLWPTGGSGHATASTAPQGGDFVPAPVEEQYFAFADVLPDGVEADRLCIPTECVFEIPGEPPRCSDDCGTDGSGAYLTTYRVDRSACPP